MGKEVVIRIGADATAVANEFRKIKKQTADLEKGLATAAKVSAAAFVGLAAAVGLSVKAFAAFEKQFVNVETLLDSTSFKTKSLDKGIDDLRKGVISLGAASGETFEDLNQGLFDLISAGVGAEDAIDTLTTATELAAVGGTNVAVAVKGLTSAMNAFGPSAGTAEQIAQKFFVTNKNGVTTIEKISTSLGTVAANARGFGVSLDEVLGAFAGLTFAAVETSQAATGLNAVFASIAKPTADAAKEAERLGIEFNSTALRAKGLEGFIDSLTEAENFNATSAEKLFGSVEALKIFQTLAGPAASKFKETLRLLNNEQARAKLFSDGLAKAQATTDKALNRLKRTLTAAAIVLGEKFAPFIIKSADFLGKLVDQFVKADKSTIKFTAGAIALATALTGLFAVLTTGLLLFVKVRAALISINVVLGISRLAFIATWAAALAPLLPIIVALVAITTAVFKLVEAQKKAEVQAQIRRQNFALEKKLMDRIRIANNRLGNARANADEEGIKKFTERIKQLKAAEKELRETGKITSRSFGGTGEESVAAPKVTVTSVADQLAKQEAEAQATLIAQQKATAQKAVSEQEIAAQKRLAVSKSTNELLLAELRDASSEEISIIKQKNDLEAAEVEARMINDAALREQELANIEIQKKLLLEKEETFLEEKQLLLSEASERQTAFQEEFNVLTDEQRLLFNEKELEELTEQLLTKEDIEKEFADKEIRKRIADRNQRLKDEAKFGKTLAAINAAVNSEELKQFGKTAQELSRLQGRKNATLNSIGKAGAVTSIGISTAKGAIDALTGFIAAIPGPAGFIAGGVAAGAVTLNGALAISDVFAARRGGEVKGSVGDTNPFMLADGELITPQPEADTFKAVIAREQNRIEAQEGEDFDDELAAGRTGEVTEVVIGLEDDASNFITAKQRENRILETDAA